MSKSRIGFIGLGAMGAPMATHLAAAGYELHVWARVRSRAQAALDNGACWAASPAALAAGCEVIILCVTDTAAVEAITFGPDGLNSVSSAAIVIDHSTIHPAATQALASRVRSESGLRWVDAPVSGGVNGAVAGTLVVMAGGRPEDVSAAQTIIDCYAARLTHMGPSGSGQASKTVNQMLIGGTIAVVAEALNFAANFGVEAATLPDALSGGWADSAVLQNHARRMAAAAYPDSVNARLMAKDVDIACDMGRTTDSPMPVTTLVQQLYQELIDAGEADKGQIGLMWLYKHTPL